jgi:hypothetical protein
MAGSPPRTLLTPDTYGEAQNLRVIRSTDGGVSASYIDATLLDANQNPARSNFIAPLILDPNDPNTLLAGGLSLWRSTNATATTPAWSPIKSPVGNNVTNNAISAIVVSPVSSNLILVGHNNGDIFRTFEGTLPNPIATWQKIDTAAVPNGRMVTRLVIDNTRNPANWIYATFGGFSDNVWRSTDNGATWADITGNGVTGLPSVPVRTLVFHPTNPNLLYVGTEIGIFTSEDVSSKPLALLI